LKLDYDKAVRFAFGAVALACLAGGLYQAFSPYIGAPDAREAEVREVMRHIIAVPPEDVAGLLHDKEKKPVMLVLYASWCAPCQVELPRITQLMHEGKLSQFKPVFLSLDYNVHDFTAYLVHHEYHTMFPSYLLKGTKADLQHVLQPTGSSFRGQIPYIGFFDAKGEVSQEVFGITENDELLRALPAR
jgi:thiol-disulfide isomerase/thioredoxin